MPTLIDQVEFQFAPQRQQSMAAAQLLHALGNARGWINARTLMSMLQLDDRTIRGAAEELGDLVISGNNGYKHVDQATTEEIRHFVNKMESQARQMMQRAEATRRRAHARLG